MAESGKKHLQLAKACLTISAIMSLWTIVASSKLATVYDQNFRHPLLHSARILLETSPQLSSKLKVYVLDDKSMEYLKQKPPTTKQWLNVIQGILDAGAERVFIDKLFSEATQENLNELASYNFKNKVNSAVFLTSEPILERNLIDSKNFPFL